MKKRNLSAKEKIHNFYTKNLKKSKIKNIFLIFKKKLDTQKVNSISVAISGGPDSMALAFLSQCYAIKKNIKFSYFTVDHKIRKDSTKEAKIIKKKLKNFGINCKILTWNKNKKISNLQSNARENRYDLIFNQCVKKKINLVLTAHHKGDLYENFFIRLLRGSGLKGLSSFKNLKSKINKNKDVFIFRPLLDFSKNDLEYIASETFNFFIKDPSNENINFLRVKVRKLIYQLNKEGLDFNKFHLTLENLFKSNQTIDFYVKKNIEDNSNYLNNQKKFILNETFFNQPDEVVFRSFSEIIHKIGVENKLTRGSKILNLINYINFSQNFKKKTLSGCIFEKSNKSIIISQEK